MSIERIGSVTTMAGMAETQNAAKRVERPTGQPEISDVVSIGKDAAAPDMRVKWPPLLPIGDTQSIFELDE